MLVPKTWAAELPYAALGIVLVVASGPDPAAPISRDEVAGYSSDTRAVTDRVLDEAIALGYLVEDAGQVRLSPARAAELRRLEG